MPKIIMNLPCDKGEREILNRLKNNLENLLEKKVPSEKIETAIDEAAATLAFKGKTVSGFLSFKGGKFDLEIEIPLLYRSFAPNIKRAIRDVWQTI